MPDVMLELPSTSLDYACVQTLAFDPAGNLWVGFAKGIVLQFAKSLLGTSGTPAPTVTIAGLGPGTLRSMRFDSAGNMFVSIAAVMQNATSYVKRLSAAQLAASNAQIVAATTVAMPSGYDAGHLTFDASGNLWVPTASQSQGAITSGQLIRYDASHLASGTFFPGIVINTNQDLLSAVFDKTGSVWLNAWGAGPGWSLYVLSATQIAQSASSVTFSKGFVGSSWATSNLTLDPPR